MAKTTKPITSVNIRSWQCDFLDFRPNGVWDTEIRVNSINEIMVIRTEKVGRPKERLVATQSAKEPDGYWLPLWSEPLSHEEVKLAIASFEKAGQMADPDFELDEIAKAEKIIAQMG